MGKIKTLEVIVRGDLIERNLVLKLGQALKDSKLSADFSASIVVPPFQKAVEKKYPSLGIFYVMVDLEDVFQFEALLKDLCCEGNCELISILELHE
ncbi:MAG: hypothetical protein ACLFU9_03060 [Candidatus Bathyarchaeia archaeon]